MKPVSVKTQIAPMENKLEHLAKYLFCLMKAGVPPKDFREQIDKDTVTIARNDKLMSKIVDEMYDKQY